MTRLALLAALALAATSACSVSADNDNGSAAAPAHDQIGVDLAGMNRSVNPGDDFDEYANGGWRARTEIPADKTRVGSFDAVQELVNQRNTEIIAGAGRSSPAPGSDVRRIADYYAAYLDTAAIDRRGLGPLQPIFRRIDAISNVHDLSVMLGANLRADVDPLNATNFWTENLFGLFVTQGLETPDTTMPYLLQGGLGMPEREYYLSADPDMARIRTAYRAYLVQMMRQLGLSDPEMRAERVFNLEMRIARGHAPVSEAQDPGRVQTWRRADLASRAPGIDWDAFLAAARLGNQQSFVAWHPAPIARLSALVASEPLDAWKDWLAFHTASRMAAVLPSAIDNLRFDFYGRTLSGQQQRPRDRRALLATSAALGDAVGRIYTERYFPAAAKADIQAMVRGIVRAFDQRLVAIDWLAPATRAEARRKLQALIVGVGYPEQWRDYSSLEVPPDDAFGNAWRAQLYEYRHQLAKLGRPVDRSEWWMTPQTVNAVNLPLQNALNFPAAILNPPFYDPNADPAFNYGAIGAIGAIIGHEISHSFDNLGATFDADGRYRNWWTPADLARFTAAGQALARQYDAYEPFPGLHLNGTHTLGENIADLAGLMAAYDAYRASLNGREAPVIGGLTGDQRFFLAYAQAHRAKQREAAMRAQIATNEHAPDQYRALTVRNLDAWYQAFDVQQGQRLYLAPDARVRVW